jgi:hypothetical protein
MTTLEEMVDKGRRKLATKAPVMAEKYEAAKPTMKEEYGRLPFGPITKRAYSAGVDAGVYRAPDADKWGRKFTAGVSR